MTGNSKDFIVGIDLGTTNTLVCAPRANLPPVIIANERGERLTPSVVSIQPDKILVGQLARTHAVLDHDITVSRVKREMGTAHTWSIQGRDWRPEDISAEILKHMKQIAQTYLGHDVDQAVITVPAYFNDLQREATLKAGEQAGFTVRKLFNEPTAAALAYGLQQSKDDNLLVFDFGGGTLDITLMEVRDGAFIVRGVGGNTRLGGIDVDQLIVDHIRDRFKHEHGTDLADDPVAHQQLLIHAQRAKIDLSAVAEIRIMIPYVTVTRTGPLHLNMEFDRKTLESLVAPILSNIRDILTDTLDNAGVSPEWVHSVVMVGGASRMPIVRRVLAEILPARAVFRCDLNPEEIVALGVGLLAGSLAGVYPTAQYKDVVSYDLGIEDDDGEFVTVIEKGAAYPVEAFRLFTTTQDRQSNVIVHIQQRASREEQRISIGNFIVKDLPLVKAGEPDIRVTFCIDAHGILQVRAEEENSGVRHEIRLALPPGKSGYRTEKETLRS